MGDSSDIVVEVIVWDGALFRTYNPYGHVTTKITKNGIVYSYSLEHETLPRKVCNTESFKNLEKHEEGLREGFGFILNVNQKQAKDIFLSMQTRFHAFNKPSCIYETRQHNCTYAIQVALKKSGVHLHPVISKIKKFQVNGSQTILPAYVEEGLLKTKNNGGWLVKDITQYKKGLDRGILINKDKVELLFDLDATHGDNGWYTTHESSKSTLL